MSREQNFLITYGLHGFVTYNPKPGKHSFLIKRGESHRMITHAKGLIEGNFGKTADIRLV